jgi:hypothetical protein
MTDMLVRSAPPSSSTTAGRTCGSVEDVGAVRAGPNAESRGGDHAEARTGGNVDGRPARHHSLIDLEREREPSWETLLNERDPWPELYTPLTEYTAERIANLVRERNGR